MVHYHRFQQSTGAQSTGANCSNSVACINWIFIFGRVPYLVSWQADKEDRRIVKEAAQREVAALERLDHPNILRALVPAESEMGPGIVFDFQPEARRLDLYLQENADRLDITARFGLLSQIADAIR